jgi:DNA-binding LacI/PurR family transcriptional regulator
MADIAREAGVSRVAVSYALNGRPGVSDVVRERIVTIARDLGYHGNEPARIMHGAAARAVGLTMRRAAIAFNIEIFRREFISGVQAELMTHGMGLTLQFIADVDEEFEVFRRWSGEQRVSGVLVCDLEVDDPRTAFLEQLGLPTIVVGGPVPGHGLSHLWFDEAAAVDALVEHVAQLGHRHIVRVSGPATMVHTVVRDEAFRAACTKAGVDGAIVAADYTGDSGAHVTRRLLSTTRPPTAVVYDNDVMAVAGLAVAAEMGVRVPADLSVAAWDDSSLCQVVRPALTVLRRDIIGCGARAARMLLNVVSGEEPRSVQDDTAVLVRRNSTGPAPAQ